MKLIRIISNKDSDRVDAESSVKLLGVKIFSRICTYEREKHSSTWYKLPQSLKVSGQKEKKLNKWIEDHEKYVVSKTKK